MKVYIYDIETIKSVFFIGIYIPEEDRKVGFEISKFKNELDSLIKFLEEYKDFFAVGYNCLRFDSQIVEWIIRNHLNWIDLKWEEIVLKIWQKAQDVIDDANYEVFPEYREVDLSIRQIDLFTIWHYNNENRRTSLKALQFSMNFENIEEMPYPHYSENLTEYEINSIKIYCFNDISATYLKYKITRGDTDFKLYKGEDKIADRLTMQEEFGLSCLNWDDVKIGAEWNKLDYIKLTGRGERDLKPKKVQHFYGKRFKSFFPKHVKFQTKELQIFIKEFGEMFVKNEKQEVKYKFNDILTATIAKGGIHSNEGGRFLEPKDDEIYYQCDIGSQYPNAIRKYKVEPDHLPRWNSLIVSKIDRRLNYKKEYQKTGITKYNSLQKMGKLALNGGSYGRLNTKGDWQEYPVGMLKVTIGGQLEILMIVEDLILKGYNVISLNTDGFDCIIKKSKDQEFKDILTGWEKVIGNDILGNFEYTEFKWIAQTSVNDYLALKMDGKTKEKGDFEIDKELHKNLSMRIVPIALKAYYVNNTPTEETIKNHKNIYDFCIRQKSSKDFHYEGVFKDGKTIYNKLIRYYVSNTGEKVLKIKNPSCTTNAAPISQVEAGDWLMKVCNYLPKTTKVEDCNINYQYYIDKCQKIIDKIILEGKKPVKEQPKNQLFLWG